MHKEWRRKTHKYASGSTLIVGKVTVGDYFWDSTPPKGATARWRLTVTLPGISFKEGFTHCETEEQAKAQIERAVDRWLEWLNHEPVPDNRLL